MWALIYKVDWRDKKKGDIHFIGRGPFDPQEHDMTRLEKIDIPKQSVAHLIDRETGDWKGTINDLRLFTTKERLARIDHETEKMINGTIHAFAPLGEQIGILREQLVHVLNALGIEPTEEFARLNEIAIKEIEASRKKKEAIDAQDNAS